ncbi:hypothetical protein [Serratia marcescens]|uniref:hypothetical protein n=1 Tax=Serratia marcescens TaxID=615 RepID=UPI0028829113|nr:hypothetical protein [Serratia marcescens]MDT0206006.1 hypothetical protein [Serratia marcescens]
MNKSPVEIVSLLKNKFLTNFNEWERIEEKNVDKVFVSIFTLNAIAEILSNKKTSIHHDICLRIFNEIIADTASSVYLSACAMDKPAHIILRRILELGVASVYLWDMPHVVYAWENHDHDLSFTEMVKHINEEGFKDYVRMQNNISSEIKIINMKECQNIYGDLSDIVHGKITSFETDLPNKFSFDESDWGKYIFLAEKVLKLIITANVTRHNIRENVLSSYARAREVIE